jgi:hypothetical protein
MMLYLEVKIFVPWVTEISPHAMPYVKIKNHRSSIADLHFADPMRFDL